MRLLEVHLCSKTSPYTILNEYKGEKENYGIAIKRDTGKAIP